MVLDLQKHMFFIGVKSYLCVPQLLEGKPDAWRLSCSLKEVKAINKLNSETKKYIRIV